MKTLINLLLLILLTLCASLSYAATKTTLSPIETFFQCLGLHVDPTTSIADYVYTSDRISFQYLLEAYIKNRRFSTIETPKPLILVVARYGRDAQATIVCAKYSKLHVRIRSGGHDFEGLSYVSDVPFILLDMSNMRNIDIDLNSESAWVQAGATLGELYYEIANKSIVHGFPAGLCPSLGIGGHFTGGGYGNMVRKYGLAVDNVIDAELLMGNGDVLDRRSMGEDLFWAIRGGGAASFGVIISWKIKLVRVPEKVTVFKISKGLDQNATDIVYRWEQVAPELPKEVFIIAMPFVVNKTISVDFVGYFEGKRKRLVKVLREMFPELGLRIQDCHEMSWIQSTVLLADYELDAPIEVLLDRRTQATYWKGKSDYVRDIISKESLEKIWKRMVEVDKLAYIQLSPYGGRMSEIPESEIPYPHREGVLFKIQYHSTWIEEGINSTYRYINALREFYDFMAPYVSNNPREASMNYRDLDIGTRSSNGTNLRDVGAYGNKYFKGNFGRLIDIKSRVDPDNFFSNEQSIPILSM